MIINLIPEAQEPPSVSIPINNSSKRKKIVIISLLIVIGIALSTGIYLLITRDTKLPSKKPDSKVATSSSKSKKSDSDSCIVTDFKSASILVAEKSEDITTKRLDEIDRIKSSFPQLFLDATQGLATMNTSYKTVSLIDDGTLINKNRTRSGTNFQGLVGWGVNMKEVSQKFYETNPDDFHFLNVYTTFKFKGELTLTEFHRNVKNEIKNIGRAITSDAKQYGSSGKLLGINFLTDIDKFMNVNPTTLQKQSPALVHETGHQWCCYLGNQFDPNNIAELPLLDGSHSYKGLESPYRVKTAMGGKYWVENNDGTFSSDSSQFLDGEKYHPFTLYFMGLLTTDDLAGESFNIYNAGPRSKPNSKSATYVKSIDVKDLIDFAGGEVGCS